MVPDTGGDATDSSDDATPAPERESGAGPGFDEAALYTVVRDAVEDALLGVIGTLLLVGIAFVLVVAGAQVVLQATAPARMAVGVGVIVVGVYLAAATLELVPPVREWV